MKNIFLLVLLFLTQLSYAQFACINDVDGFVNVRKEANSKSKIIGKITDKELKTIIPF